MNKINFDFDSTEEKYFYDWLCELYDKQHIDWIYPNRKSYNIVNEVIRTRKTKLKTKVKSENFILTKKRIYTPDFIFQFNKKAFKKLYHTKEGGYEHRPFFYCNNNRGIIYVDIKGSFNRGLSSSITFPDRQSIMSNKFNIYVQKVIPYANNHKKDTLFKKTFTPQKMLNKEVYSKDRINKWKKGESKLKYKITTVNEFLC